MCGFSRLKIVDYYETCGAPNFGISMKNQHHCIILDDDFHVH